MDDQMADSDIPAEPDLRQRQHPEQAYGEPEEFANNVRRWIDAIVLRQSQGETHQKEPQRGIGVDLRHQPERSDHISGKYGPSQQGGQTSDDSEQAGAL